MNIIRGTFRLSIVVGLLSLVYFTWQATEEAGRVATENHQLWYTLRCGRTLVGKDTKPYENEFGIIDLSKIGCADGRFLAHMHEIEKALQDEDPMGPVMQRERDWRLPIARYNAIAVFLATNLLGLLFLGGKSVFGWVRRGYARESDQG